MAIGFLLLLLEAGCTAAGTAAPTVTALPPAAPSRSAAAALQTIPRTVQRAYEQRNWTTIHRLIEDKTSARSLIERLQLWRSEGAAGLRAALDYSTRVGGSRYAIALSFSADPRVIPYWGFYLASVRAGRARIVRYATGLSGPNYQRATWTVDRTAHFTVYHSPYELEGSDRRFLRELEFQRAAFARHFGVKLPATANYYLYPNLASMRALTRNTQLPCGVRAGEIGCTVPYVRPPTIQAVIQATFHEPIHVYELALVPPSKTPRFVYVAPLFIGEGTAVALQNREADPRLSDYCADARYVPLDVCARGAMSHVDPMTVLSDRGFKGANPGDAYSLGGSFVKYLILHYGYKRFGQFYRKLAGRPTDTVNDYNAATMGTLHKPIREVIADWKRELCNGGCGGT